MLRTGAVSLQVRASCNDPAGVKEHGIDTAGSLGTWEASVASISTSVGVGGAKPEISWPPVGVGLSGSDEDRRAGWYRQAKATKRGGRSAGDSERLIVPSKQGNSPHGNPVEGRGRRVVEPLEGNMAGASEPGTVSTRQQRIAELAKQSPEMGFTSLAHHLDLTWLLGAFHRTR